jgi:hypothetical protein
VTGARDGQQRPGLVLMVIIVAVIARLARAVRLSRPVLAAAVALISTVRPRRRQII